MNSAWTEGSLVRPKPGLLGGAARSLLVAAARPAGAAVLGVTAAAALLCGVAADSRWLAALGEVVVRTRSIPDGLPYATAPSEGWPNVLVGAELAFHGIYSLLGDRGLMAAQVLAVALAWSLLAAAMRHQGAPDAGAATALLLAGVAAVPALIAVRLQLFSLVAFALLLLLLHREHAAPSRRVWLIVPLLAVWSNLHGAVLVGVAVAGAYLVVDRLRREPRVALGVLAASLAALSATPELWRTPAYFVGVLGNEAARRGEGLWAPLEPGSFLGLSFLVAVAALVALALRSRPAAWEIVAAAGLGAMAIRTERSGVWVAMLLAVPAAGALSERRAAAGRFSGPIAVGMAGLVLVALVRGPLEFGASDSVIRQAVARSGGGGVLAEPLLAEQIVAAGGTVWIANPLDAFPRSAQGEYLDWTAGKPAGDAALSRVRAVLVAPASPAGRRLAARSDFRPVGRDRRATLYVRLAPR